jgi:hypothetical protein
LAREERDEDAGETVTGANDALARPWIAATSKKPASPAQAPAIAEQATIIRPTGSPCASAARKLPPVTLAANPNAVRSIRK